jgi:hypothetical protein
MMAVGKAVMTGGNLALAVAALAVTPAVTPSWPLRADLAWLDRLLWTIVAVRVMSHAERAGVGRHREHRAIHD